MTKRAAVPSLFTICNLFCGFLSIYYAAEGRLVPASWLIVVAGFLDAFDGKIARLFDDGSDDGQFGLQFDSLADICSFGVAPAVLMLHYFEPLLTIRWLPFLVALVFLLCGALRLARFNVHRDEVDEEDEDAVKPDFIGLPIPVAAATLAGYIVFSQQVWESTREPHVALSLCAFLAFLMVSPFDYPAFPRFTFETPRDRFRIALSLGAAILVVISTDEAFFPVAMAFCLSGAVRWVVHIVTDREIADIP